MAYFKRKDTGSGGLYSLRFTWSEALDTAADVYHGVSDSDIVHWSNI